MKDFKNFLENFKDEADHFKYTKLIKDLGNSESNILHVSISDIRIWNKELMEDISKEYTKVYPHLCTMIKNFVELKVDPATEREFLVKLM